MSNTTDVVHPFTDKVDALVVPDESRRGTISDSTFKLIQQFFNFNINFLLCNKKSLRNLREEMHRYVRVEEKVSTLERSQLVIIII
jgi:hypothetical protein